jgi:ribonuclease HI
MLITDEARAMLEYDLVLSTFRKLGVELAAEKLSPPCSKLEFLGINIDTTLMQLSLPEDKLINYKQVISRWLSKPSGSHKELQSLIGILVYAARIIQHGNTFYHHLIRHSRTANTTRASSRKHIRLSKEAIEELQWWGYFIDKWNGTNIIPRSITQFPLSQRHALRTDACRTGMGAWFKNHQYALHAWSDAELKDSHREKDLSMPYLELLAILHAVNIWQKEVKNGYIDLQSDCDPVVQGINKGYSKQPSLHHLLRILFFITSLNGIFISCSHIAGVDNKEADALSRAANANFKKQNNLLTDLFFSLSSAKVCQLQGQQLVQRKIQTLPSENWSLLKRN